MIFDKESLFSDAQAITGSAASENAIDRGEQGTPQHASNIFPADLGKGTKIPLRIQVVEEFEGNDDLTVHVQVADNPDFNDERDVLVATLPIGELTAGTVFPLQYVPVGTNDRYIRLYYEVGGSNATAGRVTAGITMGNDEWYA